MNAIRFIVFGLTYGAAMLAAELVLACVGLVAAVVGLLFARSSPWIPSSAAVTALAIAVVALAGSTLLHWVLR